MNRLVEKILGPLPQISGAAFLGGVVIAGVGFYEHMTTPLLEETPTWATVAEIGGASVGVAGTIGLLACGAIWLRSSRQYLREEEEIWKLKHPRSDHTPFDN